MKIITYTYKTIIFSIEIAVLLMLAANFWVYSLTHGRTYNKISQIPKRECALVLGTSPKTKSGNANPYFIARMEAVSLLYHHGKVDKIIVSGEKSDHYDEPKAMKDFLVYKEGISENVIIQDPKGFNTEKSIMRCKTVFKQNNIIIVSQGFHNLRALFLARNHEMNALAFEAQDVSKNRSFYRNHAREFLAKVHAVIYYLFGVSIKDW